MKKLIIGILILTVSSTIANGQTHIFTANWEINFPTTTNYIKKTSFAGGKLEYRYVIKEKYSVGLAWNWASYEEYFNRRTIEKPDGSGAITSDYIAQAYQVPITATFHYYFKKGKLLRPYAGVALGAQALQQSLYYNVYATDDDNWGFVVRPELGAFIMFNPNSGFGANLALGYSFATNKTDLINSNSFSNFGITIGLVFAN